MDEFSTNVLLFKTTELGQYWRLLQIACLPASSHVFTCSCIHELTQSEIRVFNFREANSSAKRNSHLDTWTKSYNSSSSKNYHWTFPKGRTTHFSKKKNKPGVWPDPEHSGKERGGMPAAWLQHQILLPRGRFSSDTPEHWLSCPESQLCPSPEPGEGGNYSADAG